jgi:hypothetical protein
MSLVDRIRCYRRTSPLSFREALLCGLVLASISISVVAGISSPTESAGDDASLDINAEEHKSGAEILTGSEETLPDGTGILGLGSSDSGDQVKFIFDWGDGTTSETGFVDSGVNVSESHRWGSEGVYYVKVRAVDDHGAYSNWSLPVEVTIFPRVNRVSGSHRSGII